MNFSLFVAKRIYNNKEVQNGVGIPAIRIAIAGVAVGLAVMIISVSVVFGFKDSIRDKVIGFGNHIQVTNFMTIQGAEQYPIQMNDSMMYILGKMPNVCHVERFAIKQGILKIDNDFLGVVFKGVAAEYDTTFLYRHLVAGEIPAFSSVSNNGRLVISQIMSEKLNLKVGEKIFAYFIDFSGVRTRRFTIAGIYNTNLSQYDKIICYTDLYTIVKLNNWNADQTSGAELILSDFSRLNETEGVVIDKVNRTKDIYGETYSSQTITEANPQLFSWLDLLDLNVWIILALMISVAVVTMVSGLLIIILERTNMIGILKALGARNKVIRQTFLWFAVFTIGKGIIIGDIIGVGLILLQHFTGIIKLDATTYYVSVVPVNINLLYIVLLNLATLLISTFVLIVPSYLVSKIEPAKSIRYE